METMNDSYEKWRNLLLRANVIIAILVFIAEILIYFVLKSEKLILQPLPDYFFRYLILPTVIDVLILGIGWIVLKHLPARSRAINYVPVVQMTLLGLVIAATHFIFSVTLCVFCFPIFSTTLFNNKKMTQRITVLSLICVVLALLTRAFLSESGAPDTYLIEESLIAIAITLGTKILSNILNEHQNEQRNVIESSFQKQTEMQNLLNHDQLTNLYSHTAFMNHLHTVLGKDSYDDLLYVLAIINIDNFRAINDQYGHSVGDLILRRLAVLIQKYCDKKAFAARFSGTEFVILFSGSTLHQCYRLLNDLRVDFESQTYDFTNKPITFSCALSSFMPGESPDSFFERTQFDLNDAKQAEENKTHLF